VALHDTSSSVGPLPQEQVEVFEVNLNVDKPIPGMPFAGEMVCPCGAEVERVTIRNATEGSRIVASASRCRSNCWWVTQNVGCG
jgi:hypothetical protein